MVQKRLKRFWCSFFCCFTKAWWRQDGNRWRVCSATTFHLCFHLKGHWLSVPWIEGGFGAMVLMIFDIRWWNMLWRGPRGQLAKHINSRGFYGFHHLIPLSVKAVMTYSTLNETPLPRNKHVSTLSSGIMWIILASKFSSDVVNITSRGTSFLMSTSPTTKVGFDHQRADQGKLNASKTFLFETSRHQHLKPLRVHGTPRTLRVLGGQRSACIGHRSGSQYPTPSKGVATRLKFCTSLQCK